MALLVLCVPIQIVFEESVMDNLSVGFYRRIAAKIWARAIPIKQPQIDLNRHAEIMVILVICICITSLLFQLLSYADTFVSDAMRMSELISIT